LENFQFQSTLNNKSFCCTDKADADAGSIPEGLAYGRSRIRFLYLRVAAGTGTCIVVLSCAIFSEVITQTHPILDEHLLRVLEVNERVDHRIKVGECEQGVLDRPPAARISNGHV